MTSTGSRRIRNLCLSLIVFLYIASVPWYRESGEMPGYLLGLPDWVAVALLCYVGVAVLNAIAWLQTDVPDEVPDGADGGVSDGLTRDETVDAASRGRA